MAYVPFISYQFYTEMYMAGMDNPPITRNAWGHFESQAWAVVNKRNVPLDELRIDNGDFPLYLKMCVARLATIQFEKSNAPKAGDVTSEKAFSYSYTLKDVTDKAEYEKQIRDAIGVYLAFTPLHNLLVHAGI